MMRCCAPGCTSRDATRYGEVPLCVRHFTAVFERVELSRPVIFVARKGEAKAKPVVYYLTRTDRPGEVKIGTTKDLTTRLQALGSRGRTVTLLAVEAGDRVLEREHHREFGALRTTGEWFRFEWPLTHHISRLQQRERRLARERERRAARRLSA